MEIRFYFYGFNFDKNYMVMLLLSCMKTLKVAVIGHARV